jgi:hypothetical protein
VSGARALPVAIVATLVVVVLAVVLFRGSGTGAQPVAHLKPANAGASTDGEARIVGPGRAPAFLRLSLHQVPPTPAGKHYQVWLLRRGATDFQPLGAFRTSRPDVVLRLPLPGGGPYASVDVTIQADGGPDVRSGIRLTAGDFGGS